MVRSAPPSQVAPLTLDQTGLHGMRVIDVVVGV